MKRWTFLSALIIPLFLNSSWGFFAHQKINGYAVFTLPGDMISFYKKNIRYLSVHAVDPDKRRYADTLEGCRHYLDVENYEQHVDSIPEKWEHALAKYGQKHLNKNGILPWHIQKTYYYLVHAFKTHDSLKILKHSAELGHYLADAHVPLHTTTNHNGQLSNQHGIHAFWESRLPELFAHQYNYFVGSARYVNNPLKEAWRIVKQSHRLVDSVLIIERTLNKRFAADQKYSFYKKNHLLVKQYAVEYSKAYHDEMKNMVEQQMRASVKAIGDYWYTAWVDAGQPLLKNLVKTNLPPDEQKAEENIEKKYKDGKIIGREI